MKLLHITFCGYPMYLYSVSTQLGSHARFVLQVLFQGFELECGKIRLWSTRFRSCSHKFTNWTASSYLKSITDSISCFVLGFSFISGEAKTYAPKITKNVDKTLYDCKIQVSYFALLPHMFFSIRSRSVISFSNCQLSAKSFPWGVVCKFLLHMVCLQLKNMDPPVLFLAPMDIS